MIKVYIYILLSFLFFGVSMYQLGNDPERIHYIIWPAISSVGWLGLALIRIEALKES